MKRALFSSSLALPRRQRVLVETSSAKSSSLWLAKSSLSFSSSSHYGGGTPRRRQQPIRIEKISARVFCPQESSSELKGGNPVTVFSVVRDTNDDDEQHGQSPRSRLSKRSQQELARSCSWESVMVQPTYSTTTTTTTTTTNNNKNNKTQNKTKNDDGGGGILSFFMPNGRQVSFCAHACMAGGIRIATELDQPTPISCEQQPSQSQQHEQQQSQFSFRPELTVHEDDIVTLSIQGAPFEQRAIVEDWEVSLLYRMLRESCGLTLDQLPTRKQTIYPTLVHVNVVPPQPLTSGDGFDAGRPKTLVYVKDPESLIRSCHAPPNAVLYQRSCELLGKSTGLYLYTHHPERDGVFLCRHFPANSGYPEDPATGIAAAALAGSLPLDLPWYTIRQGCTTTDTMTTTTTTTDMDMTDPELSSCIVVEDVKVRSLDTDDDDEDNDDDAAAMRVPTSQEFEAQNQGQVQTRGTMDYKLLGKIEIDDIVEIQVENIPDDDADTNDV